MTIKEALIFGIQQLRDFSPSHHLDTQLLISCAIKKPKEFLFSYPETQLTVHEETIYKKIIHDRKRCQPIAYILGTKEFYGLDFFVNQHVLIPRPETELLVEETLNMLKCDNEPSTCIDVGTGSGCVPIAIVKHLPEKTRNKVSFFALDKSKKALMVAQKNIRYYGLQSHIVPLQSDVLKFLLERKMIHQLQDKKLIITANLPYLSGKIYEQAQPEVKKFEPKSALLSGKDGLDHYRRLIQHIKILIKKISVKHLTILCEIDPSQTKSMTTLLTSSLPKGKILIKKDGCDRKRVVVYENLLTPSLKTIK